MARLAGGAGRSLFLQGIELLDELALAGFTQVRPLQQQFGEQIVVGIEKGRGNTQGLGKPLGRFQLGLVFAALVLVHAGARHGGVQPGQYPELLLG